MLVRVGVCCDMFIHRSICACTVCSVCVCVCASCRHCHLQESPLLFCSLPMTQSNWAAALIGPKKPPWARGCPAERAGEGEWEQSNTTLSLLLFFVFLCNCCLPDLPRSPACSPTSTPCAGFLLFPSISSLSLSAGILPSAPLSLSLVDVVDVRCWCCPLTCVF